MSDLINRQDAIDALESKNNVITEEDYHYCDECDHVEMCRWYPMYGCEFRSRPSAERKGKWINTRPAGMSDNIVCSECGYDSIADYSFCPNCGASMERGEEDE